MSLLTLTTDSDARKRIPLIGGLWGYFAAALVGVAQHSFKSNEKHNPGQPLHWSFDKSTDHAECCARHLLDLQEFAAWLRRCNKAVTPADYYATIVRQLLSEADAHAWRALALSQTLHMEFDGAPLPFNARRDPQPEPVTDDLTAWAEDMGAPAVEPNIAFQYCQVCDTTPCIAVLGHSNDH